MVCTASVYASHHRPKFRAGVARWNADNVDFGRAPQYETPLRSKWDESFMPYWSEVMDSVTDLSVRETWVLKCSRAGGSEQALLGPLRHAVAVDPQPTLYITNDQRNAERFMERRIKLGLKCSDATAEKLSKARALEHEIYFDDMDLVVTWPRSRGAFRQQGYRLILADEISKWPEYATELLRRRAATYSYSHIVGISSPDPEANRAAGDDPIFLEVLGDPAKKLPGTDCRQWMMPDPETGELFHFQVGDKNSKHGLWWPETCRDEQGRYDLAAVEREARYRCPSGRLLENFERLALVAKGKWVATAKGDPKRRGYIVNAAMTPFESGDFGALAVGYLRAHAAGKLKAWTYEHFPRPWTEDRKITPDSAIDDRVGTYDFGQKILSVNVYAPLFADRKSLVIGTVDVQGIEKPEPLWYLLRQWFHGGDSALIECGPAQTWSQVKERCAKHSAAKVFVDASYPGRRSEVMQQCCVGVLRGAVPTFGREQLTKLVEAYRKDPFEGTTEQGKFGEVAMLTFNPNMTGDVLHNLVTGLDQHHRWLLPKGLPSAYKDHMTSMVRNDKGLWEKEFSSSENHLYDCENMSLAAAHAFALFVYHAAEVLVAAPAAQRGQPPQQATTARERRRRRPGYFLPH